MTHVTRRVVIALGVLACAGPLSARAQEAPNVRELPGVEDARQILLAAYPELRVERITWRMTATSTGTSIEAHRLESPFTRILVGTVALVSGSVVVDERGGLQSLTADGSLLRQVRQQALGLSSGRSRDVSEALKSVKAQYPPEETEKASTLVVAGLQRVLGVTVVRSHTFRSDPPPDRLFEALTWEIEAEKANVAEGGFTLIFEPIAGRLMSVVRR